ncbi:MAG: HAD family hydrolase [Candidatus Bathyarchaeota archaeon]|jgi:HAD superfamily hydrolase (TIGR01549 family)|nr:HAD family hydrolase [Candidatus Bathyarchaeota archaeon A05DMB-3]MDH7606701.1 HAD family hydrolase [Candidatus Bathyarchaeota archaeon]
MTVKAVIFDLDGTLTSFNIDYRSIRAEVRSFLISAGMPASILSINESIFEMLKKTEIFMKNNGQSESSFMKIRRKAIEIAEKYELKAAKTTGLLPGVLETLKALKKMGLKLGLCTINGEKSTNYILKKFGIAEFFDAVTPRDNVKYVKPNTEHIEATLKSLNVKPEEVVVVGDGSSDMKCARELKALAVAVPTGVSHPKELIASGANYIITSITDLPTLIESLNKNFET